MYVCFSSESNTFFLKGYWHYLELLFAVILLDVQAVRSIPVAVHDIGPSITVEVSQSDSSAMLHGILHTCRINDIQAQCNKAEVSQHHHIYLQTY